MEEVPRIQEVEEEEELERGENNSWVANLDVLLRWETSTQKSNKDVWQGRYADPQGYQLNTLVNDPYNSSRNRGFAFVEYYNNACAEYSREKLSRPKLKLDKNAPIAKWADPKHSDTSSSSQIKAVYIKNLLKNVTEDQVRDAFEHHGEIIKVVLPPAKPGQEKNRFGFVHYAEGSSVMAAIKDTEKYEIAGQSLKCSLPKIHGYGKPVSRPTPKKSAIRNDRQLIPRESYVPLDFLQVNKS